MTLLKKPIHDESVNDENDANKRLPQTNWSVIVPAGGAGFVVGMIVRVVVVVGVLVFFTAKERSDLHAIRKAKG